MNQYLNGPAAPEFDVVARTHIERMLGAKERLPEMGRRLFDALFQRGLSDDEACRELGIEPHEFAARRAEVLRSLKAAAA